MSEPTTKSKNVKSRSSENKEKKVPRDIITGKKVFVSVLLSALLASCTTSPPGFEEFGIAQDLATRQEFKEAIAYVNMALDAAPEEEQYLSMKAQLQQSLAQQTNDVISTTLSGITTNGKLTTSQQALDEAFNFGATSEALAPSIQLIESRRQALYSQLSELYSRGILARDSGNWLEANTVFNEISELFPQYEDVNLQLETIRRNASSQYLQSARRNLEEDNIQRARSILAELLAIDPSNGIARNMSTEAENRDNKDFFLAKAQMDIGNEDWLSARRNCEKVFEYDAADPYCSGNMPSVLDNSFTAVLRSARLLLDQGYLFDAGDRYFELTSFRTSTPRELSGIRTQLVSAFSQAFDTAKAEEKFGLAMQLLEKQAQIDPSSIDTDERLALQDQIEQRVTVSIAVRDFGSPVNAQDSGAIVVNNLTTNLFEAASSDIRIVDSQRVGELFEDIAIGATSESLPEQGLALYGIDIAILGSVLRYSVETAVSENLEVITYQVGNKIQDNPDYLNWKARFPEASRRQLREAPPAVIEVPDFANMELAIQDIRKVAVVEVTFSIVNTSTAENTAVETLEVTVTDQDTSSPGVTEAGREIDPLVIKTDTEMLQEATEAIVSQLTLEVLEPLSNMEREYFSEAEQHENRGEFLPAVEKYMDVITNEALKSIRSTLSVQSQERISRILSAQRFDV